MTLQQFKDMILTLGIPAFHHFAEKQTGNYIIWAEDNERGQLKGDNKMVAQTLEGTLDYFTKNEFDSTVFDIQNLFNDYEIPFRLNLINHEPDTGYTHYEWIWEIEHYGEI